VAQKVEVPGAGHAKIIRPWVAFLLALVTLGIYYIFWFGIRNSELNDFGLSFDREKNPLRVNVFLAIVANTIGALLIIPPFRLAVAVLQADRPRAGAGRPRPTDQPRHGLPLVSGRAVPAAVRDSVCAAPSEPALAARGGRARQNRGRDARHRADLGRVSGFAALAAERRSQFVLRSVHRELPRADMATAANV
jgi:hypothetical protein